MPHKQRHRGQHSQDAVLFAPEQHDKLRHAMHDVAWLLSRGYSLNASLKLVGDRFALRERQRLLVMRCVCSQQQQQTRQQKALNSSEVAGKELYIDGFNLLICIESALSGGFIFATMDGTYKDLASIHKSYKRVEETQQAIALIGKSLARLEPSHVHWYLDKPVSNSGRLKGVLLEQAERQGWNWQVELHTSPDYALKQQNGITVTSDGVILDAVDAWFNATRYIIDKEIARAKVLDFSRA